MSSQKGGAKHDLERHPPSLVAPIYWLFQIFSQSVVYQAGFLVNLWSRCRGLASCVLLCLQGYEPSSVQHLLDAPWASITALSVCDYVSKSVPHVDAAVFFSTLSCKAAPALSGCFRIRREPLWQWASGPFVYEPLLYCLGVVVLLENKSPPMIWCYSSAFLFLSTYLSAAAAAEKPPHGGEVVFCGDVRCWGDPDGRKSSILCHQKKKKKKKLLLSPAAVAVWWPPSPVLPTKDSQL